MHNETDSSGSMHPEATKRRNKGGRSVRSFVFRRARLNKLHRSAIERLSGQYVLELPEPHDHLPEPHEQVETHRPSLFDRFEVECPKKLFEIGFGMGYATAEFAQAHPEICVLGSEVYPPGVGKLLSEIEQRDLKRVRIVRRDAIEVLEGGIRENEIDAVHVFFPDPWPKKKHHKRRLVQPSFLNLVASRLKPGSYLYVTTDWDNYAEHIAEVLGSHEMFVNADPAGDDPRKSVPRSWRPRTAFEKKGLSKGHTVSEFYYQVSK